MDNLRITNVYDNLMNCFNYIEIDMEKKDLFLLGFLLSSKFIKNKDSLNKEKFLEILNEFINNHLIENNKSIFNIEASLNQDLANSFKNKNDKNKNNKIDVNARACSEIENKTIKNQAYKNKNTNISKNLREEYTDLYSQMLGINDPQRQDYRNINPNENIRKDSNKDSDQDFNLFEKEEPIKNDLHQNSNGIKTNLDYLKEEEKKDEVEDALNNRSITDKIIENLNQNLIDIKFGRKPSNDSLALIKLDSNKSETGIILTCNICQNDFYTGDLENLKLDCGHFLHFECFKAYIENRCSKDVSTANIQFFLYQLGEDYFDKYEKLCMNNFVVSRACEMMWCPTPGCEFAFEMVEKFEKFHCQMCRKTWCIKCRVKYHFDMNCIEFRKEKRKLLKQKKKLTDENYLDEQFDLAVKEFEFKPCPKCKSWIEKTYGCNHMTCICKFEFCYLCGLGYKNRRKACGC